MKPRSAVFGSLLVLLCLCGVCGADHEPALQTPLERALESARSDLKIPGCAVAIVQHDRVVLARGFGMRDVENGLPATQDTLFAIGSCTKAFTAMAAAIAQDEGKLLLDDSPKKHLPWFKLQDAEADEQVTLRDMLCHRSGLGSTDLAWYTGILNRDDVIRVAGLAKPTAKLRSKWQYQNVMYSAAGQAAGAACGTTWEGLVATRILVALGMETSTLSVKEMQQAADFSRGYHYDAQSKASRLVPTRDLTNIAPAGSINSSAREMTQWLRLMLGRGQIEGKRLVSEAMFEELTKPHMKIGSGESGPAYALGWLVSDWRGTPVLQHAGGIDGFNAYVTIFPQKKLGYVLLSNVSSSGLDGSVRQAIWDHLVEPGATPAPATAPAASTAPAAEPTQEVGQYGAIEVAFTDDRLVLTVPGQPPYPLTNIGGRRYKLENLPEGFFATFRPVKDDPQNVEVYLEQPHGNYAYARDPAPGKTTDGVAAYKGPHKDLLGTYETDNFSLEVTVRHGKVVAIVPGQPVYTLTPKPGERDAFTIPPAPPAYEVHIRRDDKGAPVGMLVKQPHGDMELKRAADSAASTVDVDALIRKAIDAAGGEENLLKHRRLRTSFDLTFENQGLSGRGTAVYDAPDASTRTTELLALGKTLGSISEMFDGSAGRSEGTFIPTTPYTAAQTAQARALADLHGPAGWRRQFPAITSKGKAKVGDEQCHVLSLKPKDGPAITVYVAESSGLVLKRAFTRVEGGDSEPVSETYSDFRDVNGVKLPFVVEQSSPSMGRVVQTVREATFE